MEFARGIYEWWVKMIDFPALILLMIFLLGIYVMYRTQKADNDFDFSYMLRDDNGKPSAARLAMFVCLGITTWGLMYLIIKKGEIDTMLFLGYAAIWSGAKVAETAIVAYSNRGKPASMGGYAAPYQPTYQPPYKPPSQVYPASQQGPVVTPVQRSRRQPGAADDDD